MFDLTATRRTWLVAALAGLVLGTSGFSSCAGATGPLFVPLELTPSEVQLQVSLSRNPMAVADVRVDGGAGQSTLQVVVDYGKNPGLNWLTVEVVGRNLTLHANAAGLDPARYAGTVSIDTGDANEGAATLRVQLEVIR